MKMTRKILILLAGILLSIQSTHALPNPAAVYCKALGYKFVVEKKGDSERGYCILPDGKRVDAWEFFLGKVAQKYNYCGINGYKQRIATDRIKGLKFGSETVVMCTLPDGKEVEMTELMKLDLTGKTGTYDPRDLYEK